MKIPKSQSRTLSQEMSVKSARDGVAEPSKRCCSVAPAGQEIGAVRESKRALLAVGGLMTKHRARSRLGQASGQDLGTVTKPRVWGGGEGNFETRAAGLLRRAYRGDMMRSEDAVFSFFATVGAGWRCFGDVGCWLLLAAPRLSRANRLSLFYPFESFVQAANHHGTE